MLRTFANPSALLAPAPHLAVLDGEAGVWLSRPGRRPGLGDALQLVSTGEAILVLQSREALPEAIEVHVLRQKKLFRACRNVKVGVRANTATGAVLNAQTFAMSPDISWRSLFEDYDCTGGGMLTLGGHRGPVVFVVRDAETDEVIGTSEPITLNELPDNAAEDENEPEGPAGLLHDLGEGLDRLGTVVTVVAVAAGLGAVAYVAAPLIKASGLLNRDDDE